MRSSSSLLLSLLFSQLFLFYSTTPLKPIKTKLPRPFNNTISAVFVFGDSTVDPGNNNFINTIFKSNFLPYGQDFINHMPTGRFTNGRLVTDFIASYIGVKEAIPPFLAPVSNDEFLTGVSFASAGTGFDPLTARISSVIPIQQQLNYFRGYKKLIEHAVGKAKAEVVIRRAVFVISAGTNDFTVNYLGSPLRRCSYSVSGYQHLLLRYLQLLIQGLVEEGARKIAVVGLPPMGCLPAIITLDSGIFEKFLNRQCVESISQVAVGYNQHLQHTLKLLANKYPTTKIVYADIFNPLKDMVEYPEKYGFEDVTAGCCGSGLLEAAILCNLTVNVCPDATKKMFWDAIHPSQATYFHLFQALRPIVDDMVEN